MFKITNQKVLDLTRLEFFKKPVTDMKGNYDLVRRVAFKGVFTLKAINDITELDLLAVL